VLFHAAEGLPKLAAKATAPLPDSTSLLTLSSLIYAGQIMICKRPAYKSLDYNVSAGCPGGHHSHPELNH
jgi:hypothetical protein